MIKISTVVSEILANDETAFEAMREGLLNYSAYAEQILDKVEEKTFKPVKKTSIVTALSRMAPEIKKTAPLVQKIKLDDIVVRSPLSDITFEKNQLTIRKAQELRETLVSDKDFLTITQSTNEITLIIPESLREDVLTHFGVKPKVVLDNLVGVSARFSDIYIPIPNVIYTIIRSLAVKRVNILEIVSTYTEISLIVTQDDMRKTLDALQEFFK
ncbi:MAG: hypothetical protein OEX81_00070 [Candidatus Pacebacteria bacterium]|nr:hypothetical protein [Candidatus Paceibacterota bacterium]